MADERVTTIIGVELDMGAIEAKLASATAAVNRLKERQKELTAEQKSLAKQYAEGTITLEEFNKAMQRNTREFAANAGEIEANNRAVKSSTALIQAETIGRLNNNASLDEQRQALNTLQKAYAQLSGEQKEMADQEGGLRDKIKELSDRVKEQEAALGDNRRNVGNYVESLMQANPALAKMQKGLVALTGSSEAASGGIKGMTKAALKFIATPIGAVIAAIAVVLKVLQAAFDKLRDAIAKNDDASTAFARLYAVTIQPIIDAVTKVFARLADTIGKVAGKIADFFARFSDGAKQADALVVAVDNLQEAERQYTEQSAKRSAEIAKLKVQAYESEKYTTEERRKFVEQAIELERKDLEERKQIAAEKLRILEAEAERNKDTSDAMKDQIAQARAAMYQAEQAYYEGTRRLSSQLNNFDREVAAERTKRAEEAKKRREEEARQAKAEADALQAEEDLIRRRRQSDLENQIEDLHKAAEKELEIKGLTEQQKAAITAYYDAEEKRLRAEADAAEVQAEIEKLQAKQAAREEFGIEPGMTEEEAELERARVAHEQGLLEDEEYEEALSNIQQKYADKRAQIEREELDRTRDAMEKRNEAMMQSFGALSSALMSVSDLLGEFADENEGAAKAQKAMALGSIVVDQAMAIASGAQGIAAAMAGAAEAAAAGGPAAPFLLIAYQAQMVGQVLATVASVASSIVQAKQLLTNAGNFAEGGVVGGSSYTGDKLIAHVNSGEGIYNGKQANSLLQEIANNPLRGSTEALTEAFAEALTNMPAPVMDYTEFKGFEQNVSNIKEIARV